MTLYIKRYLCCLHHPREKAAKGALLEMLLLYSVLRSPLSAVRAEVYRKEKLLKKAICLDTPAVFSTRKG